MSLTRWIRSGSSCMMCSAARAAAAFAGGMLALKIMERAWCFIKWIILSLPAMKPPRDAKDLLKVDLIMSTFSKSFASLGGFIAGSDNIIHFIKHHARSMIFSASIPPANAAAALAALHIVQEEPERIQRVNDIAAHMRKEYLGLGFDIGKSETPVIPILIGDDMRTLTIWKALFEAGIFVNPVIAPAVPEGRQLLRTSYMATHTDEQMSRILEIFAKVGKQVGL